MNMSSNEELVTKYQSSRDESERRQILTKLYEQNTGIIRKIAKQYVGTVELDDLMQEAFFGLVTAAERWKADGGASFVTYAVFWIRQAVKQYIGDYARTVRIPIHMQEKVVRYRKWREEYEATHGKRPLDSEVIRQLGLSPELLYEVKKAEKLMRLRSTSEPVKASDDLILEDVIPDQHNGIEDAEEQIQHEQMAAVLWASVDRLSEQEATCLRERYKAGKTLKEVGDVLGVTTERARMIEQKALRNMRRGMIAKALRPYVLEQKAIEYGYQYSGVGIFKNSFSSSVERAVISTESYIDNFIRRYRHGDTDNTE